MPWVIHLGPDITFQSKAKSYNEDMLIKFRPDYRICNHHLVLSELRVVQFVGSWKTILVNMTNIVIFQYIWVISGCKGIFPDSLIVTGTNRQGSGFQHCERWRTPGSHHLAETVHFSSKPSVHVGLQSRYQSKKV